MTGILLLQEQYLNETDPALKEEILSFLYTEIVKLGKFLAQIKHYPNDIDDIYDIASDISCRLIETQEPVIKSAPSAYISSALYFKNKDTFHDSLEDVEEPSEDSFEETLFISNETEKLQQELISYASSIITNPFIFQLVNETISYQMDAKDVKNRIEEAADKTEYSRAIRKIRQYLREKTNATS